MWRRPLEWNLNGTTDPRDGSVDHLSLNSLKDRHGPIRAPKSLQPHYRAFNTTTGRSVPVPCIGTLASRFSPLVLLPSPPELLPAVPRKSLCPTHAPSTPVAVRPVSRPPADLSQKRYTPLVLTTLVS